MSRERDKGLVEAIAVAGTVRAIGEACGVTPQAVSLWRSIPPHHVLTIERLTGIPRERLRPDIFGAPRPRPRPRHPRFSAAA